MKLREAQKQIIPSVALRRLVIDFMGLLRDPWWGDPSKNKLSHPLLRTGWSFPNKKRLQTGLSLFLMGKSHGFAAG